MQSPSTRRKFRLAMLLLSGSALVGVPLITAAYADQNWTGAVSTDWFTAGNWDGNAVPTATDFVGINTVGAGAPIIDGAAATDKIMFLGVSAPGSLTIQNGGSLTNTNTFEVGAAHGIAGTATVTGAGSSLSSSGLFEIGFGGPGSLSILNDATATADALYIGDGGSSSTTGYTNIVTVSGAGSLMTLQSGLILNNSVDLTYDTLQIDTGGHVIDHNGTFIGNGGTGTAAVNVDGPGSLLQESGLIEVGASGQGTLSITNGATVSTDIFHIGDAPTANGIVTVAGANSQLTATGYIYIGNSGTGTLNIQNGGSVMGAADIEIGVLGGSGTVTVDGANSLLSSAFLEIDNGTLGYNSPGSLAVTGGGAVLVSDTAIIGASTGLATMSVDGLGSFFQVSNELDIGGSTAFATPGLGALSITGGAALVAPAIKLGGRTVDSNGTLTVDASTVSNTVSADIGEFGTGTLIVRDGGTFNGAIMAVGTQAGSNGTVTVTGAGSSLNSTSIVEIGAMGTGALSVLNGASVSDLVGVVGAINGSSGTATVDGAGSLWTNFNGLRIGSAGTGILTISNGGAVSNVLTQLGAMAGASGTITVTGTGSNLTSSDALVVGVAGLGTLNISNGATVTPMFTTTVGQGDGSNGLLAIDGAGSALNAGANIFAGGDNSGTPSTGVGVITVTNGGTINDVSSLEIGAAVGSTGSLTVDGNGSTATTVNLQVGENGTGNLTVSNGGAVSSPIVLIGSGVTGTGNVTVSGAGALLTGNTVFYVGSSGVGNLTVSNGGMAASTSGIVIANDPSATGELNIGAALASAAAAPGIVMAPTVTFGAGDGVLIFNHTSTNYVFAPVLSGQGTIITAAGTTILTADSSGFTGGGNLVGGTLLVNGILGGAGVAVQSGATLGGSGTLLGEALVGNGATLKGIEGQTLTIAQSVLLNNASIVDVTLGAPGGAGLFHVGQNLTLDGVLNITAGAGFNAGVYRLFDYGGALTDNTLDIGAAPSGTNAGEFTVQTSVAGQVNLVDAHQSTLAFWDGAAAGNANNNMVDGGSGVWSATAPNWTDANGTTNGAMVPQPGFAIFEGAAGTVTVDASAGAITVNGMQFASDGYVVSGDPIGLAAAQTIIRVGDGTAAGAGYTTTIASVLTGTGTLVKSDLGTLVLTADNTYSGGTVIAAGTLQIGNGGTSGTITGDVSNNATLVFDRSDAVVLTSQIFGSGAVVQAGSGSTTLKNSNSYGGGTAITAGTLVGTAASFGSGAIADGASLVINQAVDGSFANVVSGTGSLTKQGAATVTITGVNTYTGGTAISAGTLTGSAASFGSGAIADNAALVLNQAADAVFANTVTGTGSFVKQGAGKLSLTGNNAYTGGTTIVVGTLELGNGGTSGAITGNVTDNGALNFNRSDTVSFSGAIAGTGTVNQVGTGATTLAGANSYTGGTVIAAGTLAGNAASFGTGPIADNGALVINQASDAAFANVILGTGSFIKQGAGSLNLTGASTLSGATTVAAGRLAVNGALAASVVTVQTGATLGGNGTVGGIIAQAGSNVGPGNSIGTLTVAGNYSAAAGSAYQVELDSAGHADRINASGTATIANGAVLNVTKTDNVPYVLGTQYTVLTAAGGVSGAYTVTGNTAIGPFTGLNVASDAHDVYLVYTQTKSFASAGGTPNQIATGGGADSAAPSGALVTALLGLPSVTAAQGAFDQLSGEAHASIKTAQIENSRFPREAILRRLDVGARQGSNAPGLPTLWGQTYGSWGTADGNTNAATLGYSSRGVLGGVDLPIYETWRVGILGGYSRDSDAVAGRSSAAVSDNYHLGGYAGTQSGPVAVRLGAVYSWHDITSARSVAFANFNNQLTGHYNAGTTQAFGEVGYHVGISQIDLEPFADLAYVSLQSGGFTETGGTAALSVKGDRSKVTFTTLGLRGAYDLEIGDSTLMTHGRLDWRHAFGDLLPSSVMSFQTGSVFTILGVPVAQDAISVGAGFDLPLASNVLLGISYDGQLASRARDNGVKLDIDWKL